MRKKKERVLRERQEILDECLFVIGLIANDYIELSHDKVRAQRDEYQKLCGDLLSRIDHEYISDIPW
jgi:hypothetical protein